MTNHTTSLSYRLTSSLVAILSLLTTGMVIAGSITGTAHDLVNSGFTGGELCVVCHTPHNSENSIVESPVWNHAFTISTFSLYSTDNINTALEDQPSGVSKLCLSCHDGVVALDKIGGNSSLAINGGDITATSGDSVTKEHPLSVTFNRELAAKDPSFYDPSIQIVTIGAGGEASETGTITNLLLSDGKVQCTSCHDVHNNFVGPGNKNQPFLRITKAGSQICLTCHNK